MLSCVCYSFVNYALAVSTCGWHTSRTVECMCVCVFVWICEIHRCHISLLSPVTCSSMPLWMHLKCGEVQVCVFWYAEVQDLSGYHGNWHGYLNRSDMGEKEWMFCVRVCVFVCDCVFVCMYVSVIWITLMEELIQYSVHYGYFFCQHVFSFFWLLCNQLITGLLVNRLVILFLLLFYAMLASPFLVWEQLRRHNSPENDV